MTWGSPSSAAMSSRSSGVISRNASLGVGAGAGMPASLTRSSDEVGQVRGLYRPGDSGTDDQRDLAATSNGACGQPEQYRRRRGGECGMVRKEKRGST